MVGGLLLSQVLTLYTTPVIYIFFDNGWRSAFGKSAGAQAESAARNRPQPDRGRRHEHLRAIHPPAGGHDAADGGDCARRGDRVQRAAGFAAAAGGFSDHLRQRAALPGASAEIMASSVATPLERQFGHIAGVTEMTSSSSAGQHQITMQFDLSRNIDGAARDVEAAINAARTYLPANLPRQSHLSQGESGRLADHDPRADLGQVRPGQAVRRSLHGHRSRSFRRFRASGR
jgi:hypothetical protein